MKKQRDAETTKALADYIRSALTAQRISGQTAPTTEILQKIATGLGVSVSEMFSGVPPIAVEAKPPEDVADAKRVARLATAFVRCDDRSQRLILELVEKLASSHPKS